VIDPHALELVAEVGETPDRFAVGADDDVPRVPELRSTPRRPVRAAGCNRRARMQSVGRLNPDPHANKAYTRLSEIRLVRPGSRFILAGHRR
jgi:hypothetical protein